MAWARDKRRQTVSCSTDRSIVVDAMHESDRVLTRRGLVGRYFLLAVVGHRDATQVLVWSALAVRYIGMAHGVLFLVFVYALLNAALKHKWTLARTGLVFGASLVPFGPLWIENTLQRAEAGD
jgi:integral membrane protein